MRAPAWLLIALGGCILPDPQYDDTRFRCEAPAQTCPDGFSCVDGWCEAGGQPDAAPEEDPDPFSDDVDAGPADPADARPTTTTSFGERPGADEAGVTRDTTLGGATPDTNLGGDEVVGIDADPEDIGLLRFDLTALPADAEVLAVELGIYCGNPIETGEYQVDVMALDWDENDATYEERDAGVLWPSPGAGTGSYLPGVIATLVARDIGFYTVPIAVGAVQAWVATPAQNFGMRWRSTSLDGRGGNFDSSESADADRRPLLRVTWR